MKLNESQNRAVLHKDGPMLVLAGPGSGKTAVIAKRTSCLIHRYGINGQNILVISYTRSAAKEMKDRFLKENQQSSSGVTFGTFHSVFFYILKCAYHYTPANIASEEVRISFIQHLVRKYRIDYADEFEIIQNVLLEISIVKNTNVKIENFDSKLIGQEEFRRIYREYEKMLLSQNLLDFDDILLETLKLFQERKDILALWQERYQYLLVDEFQDINQIQFDILMLLAGKKSNLFAVGDDDQSIYQFRGSKPEIMLNFDQVYPNCQKLWLTVNYRSCETILESSYRLIAHNTFRFQKEVKEAREEQGTLKILEFPSEKEEADYLLRQMKESIEENAPLSQIGIFFRTNMQARYFIEKFNEFQIPYYSKERIPNIYNHFIARDVISYFRCAIGGRRRGDFLQIMNKPNRYLSRQSLESDQVAFDAWQDYYSKIEQEWMADRIDELAFELKRMGNLTPFAALNLLRKGMGYETYLVEYAETKGIPREKFLELLEELQLLTKDFDTIESWLEHVENYEKQYQEKVKKGLVQGEDGVQIMTYHGCKGLEFHTVYIPDCMEGMTPYKKAVLPADIEEERRMFFVAMTRAKTRLELFTVKSRNNHEMEPSRFLHEIEEN